jgi:mRNA interferase RelE/StbE
MASYEVRLKRSAEKELRGLPAKELARIVRRIGALARDPLPAGSEKLAGAEQYRVRPGDYRIVYSVDDAAALVEVVKIGHRREVHRG